MTLTDDETRLFTDEVRKAVAAGGDWALLTGMGLPGLLAPESCGGSGAGARELVAVAEVAGAALLAAPLLPVAAMAVPALLAGCPDDPLLPALARGERRAAVALPGPAITARDGRAGCAAPRRVLGGPGADVVLIPEPDRLLAVDAVDIGAGQRTRVSDVDPARPLEDLTLLDTPVRVLATGPDARAAALRHGTLWLAAESIGAARHGLQSTLGYARTRTTFGRPIGSYQSVKHRLVDRWIDIESAAVLLQAALHDDDLRHLAAAEALDAATSTARDAVLLHGAIGFTAEHDAHRYVRRARVAAALLGDADAHRDRAADALLSRA